MICHFCKNLCLRSYQNYETGSDVGEKAGGGVGGVIGLLLIGGLIYFCCCRGGKHKYVNVSR